MQCHKQETPVKPDDDNNANKNECNIVSFLTLWISMVESVEGWGME